MNIGGRLRRVTLNSAAALLAKFVSVAVTLLLFPILISYLGKSEFAVWVAVVSVAQVLSWTDLGLGNSAITLISSRSANRETARVKGTISSAYACITVITAIVAAALWILWAAGAADWMFADAASVEVGQSRDLLGIAFLAFVCWMPSTIAGRVQTGLRMGGIPNLTQAASSIAMAALSYWAVVTGRSLLVLIVIAVFLPVVFNYLNTFIFFAVRPDLLPDARTASRDEVLALLRLGMLFFALQIAVVVLTGVDSIIALRQAGASEAVDYSVVAKLFGSLSGIGAIIFAPLWPEYGAAHARNERDWIRRTFMRSILVALGFGSAMALVAFVFADSIFALWIGPEVKPGAMLVALAAVWLVIDLCGQCIAMLLNGMAVVRVQVILSLLFAVTCLPLKWHMASSYGAVGIYAATLGCYLATLLIPYSVIIPRMLSKGAGP